MINTFAAMMLMPRTVKLIPNANKTKPKMKRKRITLILLKKYFFAISINSRVICLLKRSKLLKFLLVYVGFLSSLLIVVEKKCKSKCIGTSKSLNYQDSVWKAKSEG